MTESVFWRFLGTGSTNRDAVFTVKLVILGTDFPYWTLWVDSVSLKQQVQKSGFTEIPKTIYSHTIKIGVNMKLFLLFEIQCRPFRSSISNFSKINTNVFEIQFRIFRNSISNISKFTISSLDYSLNNQNNRNNRKMKNSAEFTKLQSLNSINSISTSYSFTGAILLYKIHIQSSFTSTSDRM